MTYYVTKPVKVLTGKDTSQEIDQAIALALLALKEEAGTDMELIGVSTTAVPAGPGPKLYVTVIAKTYQPPIVPFRAIPETFLEKFAKQ